MTKGCSCITVTVPPENGNLALFLTHTRRRKATEIFQARVTLSSHLHAWERIAFVMKTGETSGVPFVLIIHRFWLHNQPAAQSKSRNSVARLSKRSPVWIICRWHVLRVHTEILLGTQQLVCISSPLCLMSCLLSAFASVWMDSPFAPITEGGSCWCCLFCYVFTSCFFFFFLRSIIVFVHWRGL